MFNIENLSWPEYFIILMVAMQLFSEIINHGKTKGQYDANYGIVNAVLVSMSLYFGGLFS